MKDKKPLTDKQVRKGILSFILLTIAFILFLLMLFSCTPSLLTPVGNLQTVSWCTQDYVYVWKDYERTEMDSIKNVDNWMLSPGDFVICEFDYAGGLK